MISLSLPSSKDKVLLSELLSGKDVSLAYKITVPAGMSYEVIDDLHEMSSLQIVLVVERDSTVRYFCRIDNASKDELSKELTVRLVGQGGVAFIQASCVGSGTRHIRFKTMQHHEAADTKSDLVIKGVFFDAARLTCDNLIRIDKDAQRVSAREVNKNLLLGDEARVITIPKLEVEADDVSCEHGAAISRINDEHLFYLASRGIAPDVAQDMLIAAFLH